jgi:geranylgeranyl diphosphate synthase type II
MNNYKISKQIIDNDIKTYIIDKAPSKYIKNILEDCFYNGKRLRPIIALEINKSLNDSNSIDINIPKIILISEIIHTSSLIIDDLPCMDNDIERRGKPTIHYKYGETRAQIITMYLFNIVTTFIINDLNSLKHKLSDIDIRTSLIYRTIFNNLGLFGAPLGQFLDNSDSIDNCLDNCFEKNIKKQEGIDNLICKKTSTFFEIAFVISYIASGGNLDNIEKIKQCANSFGLAFQISDDFDDQKKDASKKFCPNYINIFGLENAINIYNKHIKISLGIFKELKLWTPTLKEIYMLIENRVQKFKT